MGGNLGLCDTWSLLRLLLDHTQTKASQRKNISHILHSSPLTDTDFVAALRDRYLCPDSPTPFLAYTGSPDSNLEAEISLGEGTPQGSVLSPLLFLIALFLLARALRTIPALSHAFYVDITLWVTTGNLGDIKTTLQAGVDTVATHARQIGVFLLLPRGMAPLSPSPLTVSLSGTPLPLLSTLRILGLLLQSNGKPSTFISRLTNTVQWTIRLIRRIANRHHGMREHVLRRLVQAFALSRFIYSLPFLFLSRTEGDKVNNLIRQAYKSALSLPTSISTARLLSMGVHNSLTELTEAYRTAQLVRLSRTRLAYTSPSVEAEEAAIALAITQISAEQIFCESKPAVYNYAVGRLAPRPQQWEAALSTTKPDLQLRLVTWALDIMTRHGLDATIGSLKAAHNAAF
ncbi:hypothetical protein HPB49_009839 [Dermacentor silvarum]|uniref:Uncharacterized protein n=1 Tax=Dermacentor silvarum TaxID=543639 RepID=A0ACB8DCA7_DERSI|nr:hypothetical protein HPB49_009839 [Dermacentor silvarum]